MFIINKPYQAWGNGIVALASSGVATASLGNMLIR
jgi:hypothetical protein